MNILQTAINRTSNYLKEMPKNKRKKKGQFFTSIDIAKFMVDMFDFSKCREDISVLDPGAGTGILSIAFIERVIKECPNTHISLTCYETDMDVLPILRDNLAYMKRGYDKRVEYKILTKDYILSQRNDFQENLLASNFPPKYDYVISNPPYRKISRDNPAALAMPQVVHGAPNLYFLFAAMSLFNLKDNAEMVYIMPRSWTSGAYFKAFREYFLTIGKINRIHLFISRDKVFDNEEILQETMIVKVTKNDKKPNEVLITSTNSNDFYDVTCLSVPYDAIVSGSELYVYLPTNTNDVDVINKINTYHSTMPNEGIKMKTGIVVDFRQWEALRKEPGEHVFPLFYSQHIRDGKVYHQPSGKEYDWIIDKKPGLIQKNKNYVFIKRFTAKEEPRRLQCGIYSPSDFKDYEYIGTQNKINFIDTIDGSEMDSETTYGIYALLNSTLFDMYYRILNGSTQVNSTEINNIPIPPTKIIKAIGEQILLTQDLSTNNCDRIIAEVAYA